MKMDLFRKKRREDDAADDAATVAASEPEAAIVIDMTELNEAPAAPVGEVETTEDEIASDGVHATAEPTEPGDTETPEAVAEADATEPAEEIEKELVIPAAEIAGAMGQNGDFADRLAGICAGIAEEVRAGTLSDATVNIVARGMDYDRALQEAESRGELRGRNEAVEEYLLRRDDSDGVPHPGCGQGGGYRPTSIFDLARDARL